MKEDKMEKEGILYIVGTPIGNMDDISKRVIETLKNVDYILTEDTRVAKKILDRFDIQKSLESYFKEIETKKLNKIIDDLKSGLKIAIISDAGMPCISDPGSILVKEVIENDIKINVIPGPTAMASAYSASGFLSPNFIFYGFLNKAKQELNEIKYNKYPTIIYESPNRIIKTLKIIDEIIPERIIFIGREITKIHETYYKGKAKDLIDEVEERGEIVLIIDGIEDYNFKEKEIPLSFHYKYYEEKGFNKKEIIKKISEDLDMNKNEVYNFFTND